jgi:hypothetical protein
VRAAVVDDVALARYEVDPQHWRERLLAAADYLPGLP